MSRRGADAKFGFAVVGIALLVALSSGAAAASAGDSPISAVSVTLSSVPGYAVNFTETGLPLGTSWLVMLNGTLQGTSQSSVSSAMSFVEPNGTYEFAVGSVAGYAGPPPGTVNVQGASVSMSIVFEPLLSVPEYAVNFTEVGLSSGTSWSVTLNGMSQSSVGSAMSFVEPNGTYEFTVASVPGYTVVPEGNVTVQGTSVTVPIAFGSMTAESQNCTSFDWSGGGKTLFGNCLGDFQADYYAFNSTTGVISGDNSTFTVGPFAEVTPSGVVVALGTLGFQGSGSVKVTSTPQEVNVTNAIVGNVTNAIGLNSTTGDPNGQPPLWSPSELPGGGATTTWGNGDHVLGNITVEIVFHFEKASGAASNRVEFDISVAGWPWVSSSDSLGLAVETEAVAYPPGAVLSYNASSDTITQLWAANNTDLSSLEFGPTANVTGSPSSTITVTDQVELSPAGPAPMMAYALLTFTGAGGYSKLVYDPWIVFGTPGRSTTVPPPLPVNGASLPLVAIGAVALAATVLGIFTYRLRRRPIDHGLASAG